MKDLNKKTEQVEDPLDRAYTDGTAVAETIESMADGFGILPPLLNAMSNAVVQIMFCSFMEGQSAANAIAEDIATAIIAVKDAFAVATKGLDPIQDFVDDVAVIGRKSQKVCERAQCVCFNHCFTCNASLLSRGFLLDLPSNMACEYLHRTDPLPCVGSGQIWQGA